MMFVEEIFNGKVVVVPVIYEKVKHELIITYNTKKILIGYQSTWDRIALCPVNVLHWGTI